jgi:hypothetical protein
MLANEEKLWQELRKYYLFKMDQRIEKEKRKYDHYAENIQGKFVEKDGYTEVGKIIRCITNAYYPFFISQHHLNFSYSVNRVIIFYLKLLKIESLEDFINYENSLYYDTILLFLINALENYLVDTFEYLAERVEILHINQTDLKKFLKVFNISQNFLKKRSRSANFLSEIIPERIDMQQKKKCKIAYKLLNIDLAELNPEIWENIFKKKSDGYMQRRHKIVHASYQSEIKNVNELNLKSEVEYIEKAIINITRFVHDIEWIRLALGPDPMEVSWVENILKLDYTPKNFKEFKEGIINGFKDYERSVKEKNY